MKHLKIRLTTLVFLFLFMFPKLLISQIENQIGIMDKEVTKIENTGHQVQVWKVLPEFTKKGQYRLSLKHAAAGSVGSFYIIAWADTNKDGIPDKEIGRSDLFMARNAGDWSSWEFSSNYETIFVGNTWEQSNDQIYYQMGGNIEGYKGLSNSVFYSRQFNGVPASSTGPRYTNIKLEFLNENNLVAGVNTTEVTKVENSGHQVQVWKVMPEYTKKTKYKLSIKHAAAGNKGSFYITAWADTNNDGKPDKEIGRSVLMTAKNAGDWSSWEFSSNFDVIFVGNTWSQDDEQIYYQMGGKLEGYKGLSESVFYSRSFNGVPNGSTGPRYTNIKLEIAE